MKRNCSLEDISDGKLYGIDDLVEASCNRALTPSDPSNYR